MAKSSKIRVMISSRCNDLFPLASKPNEKLSEIRSRVKAEVESAKILGNSAYEVWINEDAVENAELDSWDECMRQARDCDIFVVLFNGNAGWAGSGEHTSIGICHAEFMTAYSHSPSKVFVLNIFEASQNFAKRPIDKEFQKLIERENRFAPRVKDLKSLDKAISRIIASATVKLTQKGSAEVIRGATYLGPALDWHRMSYADRSSNMITAVRSVLSVKNIPDQPDVCVANIAGKKLLVRIGAVPDSMSVAAAREMVGQPHLMDDKMSRELDRLEGGPLHLIACQKGVTESQAQKMLGFPNATVIAGPFGVYVLDAVQGIQLVLIANCVDAMSTKYGVQRFTEWLDQSEQITPLVKYAIKRRKVVSVLASNT